MVLNTLVIDIRIRSIDDVHYNFGQRFILSNRDLTEIAPSMNYKSSFSTSSGIN